MNTRTHINRCFEFQFPDVDTRIIVEDFGDDVIIRASRDTFPDQRKACFIRELAAEGFIANCFQRPCDGIRWLVDVPPGKPNEDVTACTNRFIVRFFVGATLLWLSLMGVLLLYGRSHAPLKTIAQSKASEHR